MDNYHLTPGDGDWKLQRAGGSRAIRRFDTKQEAMQFSTQHVKKNGGSLKVHKQDGTFQEERTYPRSADPRRTKG